MRIKRPVAAHRRKQRGSAMIESTLCFLAFLCLTLGLMDFSMALYAYNFVTFAAGDAARYASLHGSQSVTPVTSDALQTRVRGQAVGIVSRTSINVTTTWAPNNTPGSTVQVQVAYSVSPMMRLMLHNNMTVSSTSKMFISN